MQNLNNQLIGKDKYITVVPNDRLYLIEDYKDLNGCFVFATKNDTYSLTEPISQDYYSFQTYQGNNYIKFADGFPIGDYVQFKIIKPEELLSLPFKFSSISSITPEALNKNFEELKRVCLLLQEVTNNRTMRLDTTDGQVMLPELKPLQTWLKDITGNYKAISLDDFKELGEALVTDYFNYIKQLMEATYNNARDNITTVKTASITEMQSFLTNFLAETEAFTNSQKAILQKIVDDFKIFINTTEIGNAKLLQGYSADDLQKVEQTLETFKKSTKYKEGDIVKIFGVTVSGDGLGHSRKISKTNDGTGVQIANGLFGNVIINSDGSKKQDKEDNGLTTLSKDVVKAINEVNYNKISNNGTFDSIKFGAYNSAIKNRLGNNVIRDSGLDNISVIGNIYGDLVLDTKENVKIRDDKGNESPIWNNINCPTPKTVTGYQKLASGLIIQWGGIGTGVKTITFPIAFSGQYRLFITASHANGTNPESLTWGFLAYLRDTLTQFDVVLPTTAMSRQWIAVGI